jgi:hypothetical protein
MEANTISLDIINSLFYVDEEFRLRNRIYRNGYSIKDRVIGCLHGSGYLICNVNFKSYQVHRILFQIYNQIEELDPKIQIDHINSNKLDNSPINLRLATKSNNQHNRGKPKNNKSGFKGVSWNVKAMKFTASIRNKGTKLYLGSYETPEEAYSVYCAKALELHGEFANLG